MLADSTCLPLRKQTIKKHWAFHIPRRHLPLNLRKPQGAKQFGGDDSAGKKSASGMLISHRALMSRLPDGALTVAAFVRGLKAAAAPCYESLRPRSCRHQPLSTCSLSHLLLLLLLPLANASAGRRPPLQNWRATWIRRRVGWQKETRGAGAD